MRLTVKRIFDGSGARTRPPPLPTITAVLSEKRTRLP